jgi:catechol 2,3-dioxygenase-like lactoylglutathione lyase family enzyme
MITIGSIVLRVTDLTRERAFWVAVLDYVPRSETSDDFALLSPRSGGGPNLSLDQVRTTDSQPRRFHLDLYADDQAAEVERLVTLGATRVDWANRPEGADYVILADPEGNRFCVVDAARSARSGETD